MIGCQIVMIPGWRERPASLLPGGTAISFSTRNVFKRIQTSDSFPRSSTWFLPVRSSGARYDRAVVQSTQYVTQGARTLRREVVGKFMRAATEFSSMQLGLSEFGLRFA